MFVSAVIVFVSAVIVLEKCQWNVTVDAGLSNAHSSCSLDLKDEEALCEGKDGFLGAFGKETRTSAAGTLQKTYEALALK